jgi:tol-pal system protein YbgF
VTTRAAGRTPRHLRLAARLAPVAFLATGACVASRNDVRVLQQDLSVMRVERAQADSARDRQLAQLVASLTHVNDSLVAVSGRMTRFQGDALGNMVKIQEQLIQVQELTGQSQRVIRELRSELEQRAQDVAAATGDTTRAQAGPGPTQLYELASGQLRRNSYGAAREGFQQLLTQYPTSDLAPDAQFFVAESFAAESQTASADSAYRLVAEKYPNSPRSATALYKLGLSLARQGNTAGARAALDDVVKRYPRSDEAELARERLRTLK